MKSVDSCIHLTSALVIEIHLSAIKKFGGSPGIRSQELLDSGVAAPQASFGGESPFADLIEVAAAYLFYLCANHPFIDGNKRAALGACLVFLKINGATPSPDSKDWETITLDVAAGKLSRGETTERLRKLVE